MPLGGGVFNNPWDARQETCETRWLFCFMRKQELFSNKNLADRATFLQKCKSQSPEEVIATSMARAVQMMDRESVG